MKDANEPIERQMKSTNCGPFDNRKQSMQSFACQYRRKVPLGALERARNKLRRSKRFLYKNGGVHFHFELNGTKYNYAYIRKNACSTIISFISTICIGSADSHMDDYRILRRKHATTSYKQLENSINFFVFRDPLERCISLFKNKFVQDSGNSDIFENFSSLTGMNPENVCFMEFCELYIQRFLELRDGDWQIDPHCVPQADHLWPIEYQFGIDASYLNEWAYSQFGPIAADTFRKSRSNSSTTEQPKEQFSDCWLTPVNELRRIWRDTGVIPSWRDFVSQESEAIIRESYSIDYQLVSSIGDAPHG